MDELVVAMNRAAEDAVPTAKALFVKAARAISVEDALKVVRGGSTSVTDFFAGKTRLPLSEQFLPIVTQSTQKVSLAIRYNAVAGKAAGLGLVKGDEANVEKYVTGRALDALYLMIGEEELKIRADPVKTGSSILRKVFGVFAATRRDAPRRGLSVRGRRLLRRVRARRSAPRAAPP